MKAIITGHSSGIGDSLARIVSNNKGSVFGISRSSTNVPKNELILDFENMQESKNKLQSYFDRIPKSDYLVLNAGILGRIDTICNTDVDGFKKILQINLLSNKIIIDTLHQLGKLPPVVLGISSGASLKPKYGWAEYCVSKAAFKMLLEVYSVEIKETKFISLAPGVVKTKMQDQILSVDSTNIPSVKKFHDMYDDLPTPEEVAKKIYTFMKNIDIIDSQTYVDLRKL